MIVSDKYIFIHFPKTGGTFVSTVIENYLKRQIKVVCKIIINSLTRK